MQELSILYENDHLLAVFKPAGIAVQTQKIAEADMLSLVRRYLTEQGIKASAVEIAHRLDQPVCGVIVFAKDKETLKSLNRAFATRECTKRYYAVVAGIVEAFGETLLSGYIKKDPRQNQAVICRAREEGAKEAKLSYRTVRINRDLNRTLLDINLLTGRFHQIRAQLSDMGHPIIGDTKYGDAMTVTREKKNGIALCARYISVKLPGDKTETTVALSENSPEMLDFLGKWF